MDDFLIHEGFKNLAVQKGCLALIRWDSLSCSATILFVLFFKLNSDLLTNSRPTPQARPKSPHNRMIIIVVAVYYIM